MEIFLTGISPDGQRVANLVSPADPGDKFAVQFLDLESGTRTPPSEFRSSNAYYADIVWRPDGRMVASAHNDQWVDLWDGVTGRAAGQHRVPDRYGVVDSVRFSGDNTRLIVGTRQGYVYAVDASTFEILGKPVLVEAGTPVQGLATNGDGGRALVWLDHRFLLLDLQQGGWPAPSSSRLDVTAWAWSPDGEAVVVAGSDPSKDGHGTVALLDPETLAIRDIISGPNIPGGSWIQFSADGTRFATSGSDRVGLWDLAQA